MRWTFNWFGHGFGFGIWRTRYAWDTIYSVCFLTISIYISVDNSKDKP